MTRLVSVLKHGLAGSVLVLLAGILGPPSVSAQPPNVFVCVNNLTVPKGVGGTRTFIVNNCLGIIAFGFGLTRDANLASGLSSTSTRYTEVSILKEVDAALSPWLTMSGITGSQWDKVSIENYTPGCVPGGTTTGPGGGSVPCVPVFKLDLTKVQVTSVSTSASTGGLPIENVTLIFLTVTPSFPGG